MQDLSTYHRLTLEFLRTFEHSVGIFPINDAKERIKFQLMNRSYDMNVTEWCNRFEFVNNNRHIRTSNGILNPQPYQHFKRISVECDTSKGGNIVPCYSLFFMLLLTLCRHAGEFRYVNEDGMLILAKAAQLQKTMTPNLETMLLLDRKSVV